MKILVTGAKGFIGKNLVTQLRNKGYETEDILEYDLDTDPSLLDKYCSKCEFIFHLAGVNRPKEESEFMEGNFGFTSTLLDTLKKYSNKSPIMLSSSIQASLDNPYGKSKRAGEELLLNYGKENDVKVYVYRFPNVFGKWSRPNYNSAIATFCYNIARDIPIKVNDPNVLMNLVYIDDVLDELIRALQGTPNIGKEGLCEVPVTHEICLGDIADLLYSFKASRGYPDISIPDMSDPLTCKLYATYTSFIPEDGFGYPLKMNVDERGSFTEMLRTPDRGQVSVNISHPGIVKGNHWHHTKTEKFLVVAGKGVIRFRKVNTDLVEPVQEYFVSQENLTVIDIPAGYTHNIENLGDTDMITIMWASEPFDPENPDTYYEPV